MGLLVYLRRGVNHGRNFSWCFAGINIRAWWVDTYNSITEKNGVMAGSISLLGVGVFHSFYIGIFRCNGIFYDIKNKE